MSTNKLHDTLRSARRLLLEAELHPMQGDRFQPTGFADLGAGVYQLHDGTRMLLVESAQSVANRLESTVIGPDGAMIDALEGLPYVAVQLSGASGTTTSSLSEAHRLNSPFIISDKEFQESFKKQAGYEKGKTLDWRKVAATVFHYDPNCLLHGVFMANLDDGRVRLQRALSGFIEARNVKEVVTGGVKNNPIDPSGTLRAESLAKDVYGNVPYQRVEYTAEKITAYFNLDLGLLRSYDLGDDAFDLLASLALFKVRSFVDGGLRLRTACDLRVEGPLKSTEPAGIELPSAAELLAAVKSAMPRSKRLFANPPVTRLKTKVTAKESKTAAAEDVATED